MPFLDTALRRLRLLGDPAHPEVVVTSNGGADAIYLPGNDRKRASEIVKFLTTQDYVGAIFVHDRLGRFPGALVRGKQLSYSKTD